MLKAAVDTQDPATVGQFALEYQPQLPNAQLFAVADNRGVVLARLGTSDVPDEELAAAATVGRTVATEHEAFWPEARGILLIKSVPIWIDKRQPDVLGTLILGASLDDAQARRFKELTNSEIAFGVNGIIKVATLPESTWPALATLLGHPGVSSRITLNGEDYFAFANPLGPAGARGQPIDIVLRSQSERQRFLTRLHTQLGLTAVVAVLMSVLLSYAVARTVTRPIESITSTMREMAASGDLTRRIPVSPDGRWQDEDARLLATTFNSMTDSIEKFQREASQRERLSSLGRLSTVVAHEIRNPLMIIKTSLRTLRREDAPPEQAKTAVKDIDEEITRLNRIVAEVLDFARPIKFELSPTDLNALAADAVRAAEAAGGSACRPARSRSGDRRRSRPTGNACGRRWSISSTTPSRRCRPGAPPTSACGPSGSTRGGWPSRCPITAAASPRRTCHGSSTPTSRPGGPAPASVLRSRATSLKAWEGALRSPASAIAALTCASSCPLDPKTA